MSARVETARVKAAEREQAARMKAAAREETARSKAAARGNKGEATFEACGQGTGDGDHGGKGNHHWSPEGH